VKKINLSKELLLNGVLIGVISIGLASCGGGGGGGSGSLTPTSPGGSGPSTPLSYSTYLYAGTNSPNEQPIITVYIDGQPVKLLANTEVSGLVVNSTAVNIPSSDMSSNSFAYNPFYGDMSGTMASATVCLNPSITNSCVVMPIGVMSSNTSFPATGEAQGVFGLASDSNSLDIAVTNSGGIVTGYSYPTYLERQYGINSYTISFYPLTNGYYSDVSSTTPIGYISFGVYNGNSNTLIPYTLNGLGLPSATVIFPSSTTSFTGEVTFDTGNRYIYLTTGVLQTEISNFSQTADEGACASYTNYGFSSSIVNGGYSITYLLQNNSGSFYSGSFTTEPSLSFCEADIPFTLMEGVTVDNGPSSLPMEFFGLYAMLGHTFTWVLDNNGIEQYIGINP